MNKKQLMTNFPVSSLGYGCYALCGAYGAKLEEAEIIRVLRYANELGINFYDTSGSYTNTEELLGRAIKLFRHNIIVASKVGLTEGNQINLSKESVRASCEKSLKKLNTDYIDIYQVHYHDPATPIAETIEALEALKREGKIRYYGIGHLPLDKTLEYLKLGDISFVLAEMSPVNTYRYRELHGLQEKYDFEIIAFSITGRGILSGAIHTGTQFTDDDIRSIDPLFKRSRLISGIKIKDRLKEIGSRYGKTSTQVAISWTIQNKGIFAGLTGPCNMEHLYENSQVLNWRLDKACINEINCLVEKEEEELEKLMDEEVYYMLNNTFSFNFEKSCKDLIYVIEYCIENKLIPYEDGVRIYMIILSAKNSQSKSLNCLNKIKSEIKVLTGF